MHTSLVTYQVFLTRNSEYHLQSHVCVGVRDRRTGRWLDEHPALQRPLATTVRTGGQLAPLQKPQLGESLEFDLDGSPLRTSPVLNIEERGGRSTHRRTVMAPRSSSSGSTTPLAATFPSAPLPVPANANKGPVKTTPSATPKPPANAAHKPSKGSRWLFRRRPRVSTAERNAAAAQEAARSANSTVTTRTGTQERPEDQRIAR